MARRCEQFKNVPKTNMSTFCFELRTHGQSTLVHQPAIPGSSNCDTSWEDTCKVHSSNTQGPILEAHSREPYAGYWGNVADTGPWSSSNHPCFFLYCKQSNKGLCLDHGIFPAYASRVCCDQSVSRNNKIALSLRT